MLHLFFTETGRTSTQYLIRGKKKREKRKRIWGAVDKTFVTSSEQDKLSFIITGRL
jgi:hypothetical protein